jgi:tetratricopeptide (TPR) repeat protein
MVGAGLIALLLVGRWVDRAAGGTDTGSELGGDLVLLPFSTSSDDSTLRSLATTVPEMLGAGLMGPGEVLVPAATVRSRLQRLGTSGDQAVSALATQFGAWQVLDGRVSGGRAGVAITATLAARSGRRLGTATVIGSPDSLATLVERLTTALLMGAAGGRLVSAGPVAPSVLREYLWALNDFGRLRLHPATEHARRALAMDSSFAPGAFLLYQLSMQTDGTDAERATRLAWTNRSRLRREDRDLLGSLVGPGDPSPPPVRERLRRLRDHTANHLQHADGWYELGNILYNWGHESGEPDPWGEARSAWERALSLDSVAATPAIPGLIEMAAILGDTALLHRLLGALPPRNDRRGDTIYRQWLTAFTARDTLALSRIRPALGVLDTLTLLDIRSLGLRSAFDLATVDTVTAAWAAKVTSAPQLGDAAWYRTEVALTRGRRSESVRLAGALHREWDAADRQAWAAVRAAWWEDDPVAGATAASTLMEASLPLADDPSRRGAQLTRRCAAEQFRVSVGTMETARVSAHLLREHPSLIPPTLQPVLEGCALYLEGMAAASEGDPRAAEIAAALDAWQREVVTGFWLFPAVPATGRLWIAVGDWARASAALERRSPRQVRNLPMTLRMAGEAAAHIGNREAAIRAYESYLALRSDPEPALQTEADQVRDALRRLKASGNPETRTASNK